MHGRLFALFIMTSLFFCLMLPACGEDDSDSVTTDGDATDGDTGDGDTTDGDTTDGDATDGDALSADFEWVVSPSTLSVWFEWIFDQIELPPGMSFEWDFGDGATETTDSYGLNHEYALPGDYDVTLTVTDADGAEATSSQTITIDGYGVVKWKHLLPESTEHGVEAGDGEMALGDDGTIYAQVYPVGGARLIYSIAPDATVNWRFDDFDNPERGDCSDPVWSNVSETLYVICNLTPGAAQYTTVVTAINKNGNKKWSAILPDGQTAIHMAITMRSFTETATDELYIGTSAGPEVDQPASIYTISHNGTVSKSAYENAESIGGMAFGPSDTLYIVTQSGNLEVLTSSLSYLWSYTQPEAVSLRGYMAIDADGRVFIPLMNPPSVQAFHINLNTSNHLLYTIDSVGEPGPPTIDANGRLCFIERSIGIRCHDVGDGALIWESSMYAGTGWIGIAALENGMIIAEMENAQVVYTADGEQEGWGPPAQMRGVATVADDGTFYTYGRRDFDTVYTDALFAIYGPSPLSKTWTRYRGDNANTARYISITAD